MDYDCDHVATCDSCSMVVEREGAKLRVLTAQLGAAQEALTTSLEWLTSYMLDSRKALLGLEDIAALLRQHHSPITVAWVEAAVVAADRFLERSPWPIGSEDERIAETYELAVQALDGHSKVRSAA